MHAPPWATRRVELEAFSAADESAPTPQHCTPPSAGKARIRQGMGYAANCSFAFYDYYNAQHTCRNGGGNTLKEL